MGALPEVFHKRVSLPDGNHYDVVDEEPTQLDNGAIEYEDDDDGDLVAESADNCGTGAGGFQPGNDCAKDEEDEGKEESDDE